MTAVTSAAVPIRVLSIAGSDSGGGAGIQADLKTLEALGVHGMTAVTAVTAQNTVGVRAVQMVRPDVVAAQIDACFEDIGVDAVKIGMLGSVEIVQTVAEALRRHRPEIVVLDPVMVSTTGARLLAEEAERVLCRELAPLASLMTPNHTEASILFAKLSASPASQSFHGLAEMLRTSTRGGVPVLMTGGDQSGALVVDLLVADGEIHEFRHPRIESTASHGTGCTLSTAIAAHVAAGHDLVTSIRASISFVEKAIGNAWVGLGAGPGPLSHRDGSSRDQTLGPKRES